MISTRRRTSISRRARCGSIKRSAQSPAMFRRENRAAARVYWLGLHDAAGGVLDGRCEYTS